VSLTIHIEVIRPDFPFSPLIDMSDFSDKDDIELFRAAKMFVDVGSAVDWDYTLKKMKKSKKTRSQLQGRLKTMKQRWGVDLNGFPIRFLSYKLTPQANVGTQRKPKRRSSAVDPPSVAARSTLEHTDGGSKTGRTVATPTIGVPASVVLSRRLVLPCARSNAPTAVRSTLRMTKQDAWNAVQALFATVPRAVVRQTNNTAHNVGEIIPVSVSEIIDLLGMRDDDVFVDVGAGIGNVAVQVALETNVRLSVAVEMRKEVLTCGEEIVARSISRYSMLQRVRFIPSKFEDITDGEMMEGTVLYSFNTLFEPASLLRLESLVCKLSTLRALVLAIEPCPRHRDTCTREFCMLYELAHEVKVGVTYAATKKDLYVYARKNSCG
jgi:hypothetical protein